ncbi:MAG: hypothetical protein K2H56_02505, partial [Malacoplasma sp.]|nr:hypothetical protein [Malacoplasma sp.]
DNPGDQTNPDNPGDQQDPESKISYAPETDIFTYQIIFVEKQDNEGLDKVLRSLFADKSLLNSESKYLLNVNEYENVKLTYVENSANFSEKTFNISVTPINEGKWEDGKSDSKIVVTKLSNLKLLADAQVPISAKITNNVTGNFASDKDLEDYLVKNYGSLKFAAESGTNFTNTLNEYVQNSANLKDKTFRIKVWPQEQHSWKDGTGNGVKEMLVNIPNLTQQSSTPIPISPQVVRAPIFWTVNSTILSNYKETWNGWKWTKSYLIFGLNASENDWILQTIFENAMKDYQKFYQVDPVDNYKSARWEPIFCFSSSWHFFFRANVKPKNGFKWANGTTDVKEVQFNFYAPVTGEYQAGTTTDLSKLSSLIDSNYDSNGLPNQWVSSFGAYSGMEYNEETRNYVAGQIRKELIECYWGAYDFSVTDVRTISGSDYPHQTWIYKVNFIDNNTRKIIKTIPGYQPCIY